MADTPADAAAAVVIPQPSASNPVDGDVAVASLPKAAVADAAAVEDAAAAATPAAGEDTGGGAAAAAAAAAEDDGLDDSTAAGAAGTPRKQQRAAPPNKDGTPTRNPSSDLDRQIERLMQCECVAYRHTCFVCCLRLLSCARVCACARLAKHMLPARLASVLTLRYLTEQEVCDLCIKAKEILVDEGNVQYVDDGGCRHVVLFIKSS